MPTVHVYGGKAELIEKVLALKTTPAADYTLVVHHRTGVTSYRFRDSDAYRNGRGDDFHAVDRKAAGIDRFETCPVKLREASLHRFVRKVRALPARLFKPPSASTRRRDRARQEVAA